MKEYGNINSNFNVDFEEGKWYIIVYDAETLDKISGIEGSYDCYPYYSISEYTK